jgi:hypothetical protein
MNRTTLLGDKLHPYPEHLKLATKVGARLDDADLAALDRVAARV